MSGGILIAIVGGVIVVGLIVWFAAWIMKRANAKYAQLWGAIADVVSGTSKSSKLTGTYEGMPVQAKITTSGGGDTDTTYSYDLALTVGARGQDWSLQHTGDKMLGLGTKAWRVKTGDDALATRLSAAGVPAMLEQWDGKPSIVYRAKKGTLSYHITVGSAYSVPGREQFQRQLDLLASLARINAQVNGNAAEAVPAA